MQLLQLLQPSLQLLLPQLPPQKQLMRRIQISQSQLLLPHPLPQLLPPRMPLPLPQPPQKSRSRIIQMQLLLLLPPRMLEPQPQLQLLEHKFPIMNASKKKFIYGVLYAPGDVYVSSFGINFPKTYWYKIWKNTCINFEI